MTSVQSTVICNLIIGTKTIYIPDCKHVDFCCKDEHVLTWRCMMIHLLLELATGMMPLSRATYITARKFNFFLLKTYSYAGSIGNQLKASSVKHCWKELCVSRNCTFWHWFYFLRTILCLLVKKPD